MAEHDERTAWLAQRNAYLTRHTAALENLNDQAIRALARVAYHATGDIDTACRLVAQYENPVPHDELLALLAGP